MVQLLPHQRDAVEKLSSGKVLWGGVGTGKSLTVLAYYMEKQAPKNIYVITTAKKRDKLEWEGEAAKYGIFMSQDVDTDGTITVDSWNNIGKYEHVEDAFFVFDEQRLVGNGAWVKAFRKIAKSNDWVLLTATPGDTWLDYVPLFIANGLYRNPTEFKREHVVYAAFSRYPKIDRYVNTDVLEKYRNMLLVEMPFIKHTIPHVKEVECDFDRGLVEKVLKERWNIFTDEPCRDKAEAFRVLRRIVASDGSRLSAMRELISTHPRLIVFYNYDYELLLLRKLCAEIGVEYAEWNGHRHHPLPESQNWVYLTQYAAGAEGWNCTTTDAMVFYSLTYSYKLYEQGKGRIDRLDTPYTDLYYYILWSNSIVDRAVRRAQKAKKLFNERDYAEKLWEMVP